MSKHEPTEEMILAGIAAANRTMPYVSDAQCVAAIWKAMQAVRSQAVPHACTCESELKTGWTTENAIPLCNVCGMVDVAQAFAMSQERHPLPQGVEEWIANAQVQLGDESPAGWGNYIPSSEARAYLSGMAIVPVDEITPEMWQAGRNEFCRIYDKVKYAMHSEIESAEIDAAPQSMMTAMLAATKEKGE